LTSFWIDKYLHVQVSLVRISWQCSEWINIGMFKVSLVQYWDVQSLVNANLYKSLDSTLNGPIFTYSKSHQCKFLQISQQHFEWTNIGTFKVSSMQISTNLSTALWMDQYWHVQSLVNANLNKSLDSTLNGPILEC